MHSIDNICKYNLEMNLKKGFLLRLHLYFHLKSYQISKSFLLLNKLAIMQKAQNVFNLDGKSIEVFFPITILSVEIFLFLIVQYNTKETSFCRKTL